MKFKRKAFTSIDFRELFDYINFSGCCGMIAENIKNIRKRIEEACFRCGRKPGDITLVAVTKTFGIELIKEAIVAGQLDFGENYAQELNEKRIGINDSRLRWHFIGHLQSNKVKYVAEYIHLVHTVDNERVAEELQKRAERLNRSINVLVEVHTTNEPTKTGVVPEKTVELMKSISRFNRVQVQGLMTMGPFSDDPDHSRPSFRKLVELKREIDQAGIANVSTNHLSMGMSHDFEVGIEEGATIIRIGTAVFGQRQPPQRSEAGL